MLNTSQKYLSNGECIKRSQLSVTARMEEKLKEDDTIAPDRSIVTSETENHDDPTIYYFAPGSCFPNLRMCWAALKDILAMR
jgi:hypothetical protein